MIECPLCGNKFNIEDGYGLGRERICERCIAVVRCDTVDVVKNTIMSHLRGESEQYMLQIDPVRVVDSSFQDGYNKCMSDIINAFKEDNVFICWRNQKR